LVNVDSLVAAYRERFPDSKPGFVVRAPGRVNLIGEHVDYHGGLVLPIAIEPAVYAVAGRSNAERVHVFSAQLGASCEFALTVREPVGAGRWENYVRGVVSHLSAEGCALVGANIHVDGDLPIGAGLSSSAAIEVATAMALLSVAGETMPMQRVAQLCRSAEHTFARVPCGIMDQMACACARERAALLIDCQDQSLEFISWPDGVIAVVVDSGARHQLGESEYAQRAGECAAAMACLKAQQGLHVSSWREITPDLLNQRGSGMSAVERRRAHHVVTEIARTRAAADALGNGDVATVGRLMTKSHASLRDDYEVSTPELDRLVEILTGVSGVFGTKLTGAGFGGCVVAIAKEDALPQIEWAVRSRYDKAGGAATRIWATTPRDGAAVLGLPT